jgi:hypothetical protein
MEFNLIIWVDYQEELNLMIGKLEKECLIIIMIMLLHNIIYINGNQQMIVVIIHVDHIMLVKILLDS